MFETKNLTIGYHSPLISDINLQFKEGQIAIIYGCNGSGKSTLLKTLSGLIAPLSGDILYQHQSLVPISSAERASIISFCLTQVPIDQLTVQELIEYSQAASLNTKLDYHPILEALNILSLKKESIQNLSDGLRQKAMIARCIAQNTPIIYLDEPTAFLDYKNKKELMVFIKEYQAKNNTLFLINSHEADWLNYSPDHIIGISGGVAKQLSPKSNWSEVTTAVY